MIHSTWRPYLALGVGVLATSSASIFIRIAQHEGASSLVIAASRVALATLILTPIILARYRPDLARLSRRGLGLALLSGVLLSIHFATWVTSLEYTSVLTSVTLVTTNPLFVALASPFLLREKLGRGTLIGIVLAIIGGVVISAAGGAGTAPRQDAPLFGAFLAMLGSLAVAGYFIIGRRLRPTLAVIPYIWLTYGSAALACLLFVLLGRQPVTGLSGNAYLAMILMAVFPQLLGHSSFNYALGYLRAAYVSLAVLAEPVFSTILAVFFLSEQPLPLQLGGGLLIMVALVIASREEARTARQLNETPPATEPVAAA
jgi:drug/metabolite transporter (DMT)-like permease